MREVQLCPACLVMAVITFLTIACGTGDSDSNDAGDSASASPTTVASEPLPTLNEAAGGIYFDLTFEQAQQLTPFDLVMPDPIPPAIEFVAVNVPLPPAHPSPEGTPDPTDNASKWGTPTEAVLLGFQPVSAEEQPLSLSESPESMEMDHCPDYANTTITVEGASVTTYVHENPPGETFVFYCWEAQGLNFTIQAMVGPELSVTEEDLEQLVAATL